ncbi:MAG: hypothetical protein FJ399_17215, partial [Verrucomicrobia bacterium]|nr:hypothetical protein [Verrucomicrobiota bacterium]
MHRLALDETAVLLLANLILDLVDRQLRLELEEIVQHLHATAGEMIDQVGIGPVLLVQHVGQDKELLLRVEERFLHSPQAHLAVPKILVDAEGNKGGLEHVLIETVVAQRLDQFDQMLQLARIDDTQAIDIPADGIAGLGHPPVMIFAETNNTPVESGNSFGHGRIPKFFAACEGRLKKQAQKRSPVGR